VLLDPLGRDQLALPLEHQSLRSLAIRNVQVGTHHAIGPFRIRLARRRHGPESNGSVHPYARKAVLQFIVGRAALEVVLDALQSTFPVIRMESLLHSLKWFPISWFSYPSMLFQRGE